MLNGLSVDVEDWYQGLGAIPFATWNRYEHRLTQSLERTLHLFASVGVTATFFVLGYNAEHYPHLVRMIQAAGHELGTHGYSHRMIYDQTPAEFRAELQRAIAVVEDISGQRVQGHRAAAFSIVPRSAWAIDILLEAGLTYDSSIFPVRHYRYGWPGAPPRPCRLQRAGGTLIEFPLPTLGWSRWRLPIGGGAYQRILPEAYIHAGLRQLNRNGHPFVLYLHPWELDPEQPRIALKRHIAWSHYANLAHSEARFARLLRAFQFGPIQSLAQTISLPIASLPND